MLKQYLDNWKYGSDPQNADFNHLPFDYDKRLIPRQPIDRLTNNIIEWLNNILIKRLFEKVMYLSNPLNAEFDDLPFDYD